MLTIDSLWRVSRLALSMTLQWAFELTPIHGQRLYLIGSDRSKITQALFFIRVLMLALGPRAGILFTKSYE
jgi:hypothetical protein